MIDFPASPITGQVFSSGSKSWIFNGVGWALRPILNSPGIALAGRRDTYALLPTTGLSDGDAYFVSADGQAYVYDSGSFPAEGDGIQIASPQSGYFQAYDTLDRTYSAGSPTAILNTVVENSVGTWNSSTNELTISKDGIYSIVFARQVPTSPVFAEPTILVNGVAVSRPIPAGSQFYSATSTVVRLVAGDIVRVSMFMPSTGILRIPLSAGLRVAGPL